MQSAYQPVHTQEDTDPTSWRRGRRPTKTEKRRDDRDNRRQKTDGPWRQSSKPTTLPSPPSRDRDSRRDEPTPFRRYDRRGVSHENPHMNIDVRKSCKANIEYDGFWFQPTEILRDVRMENGRDTFLEKIFDEKVFGQVSLDRPDGTNMYLIKPTLTSLVRITKNKPQVYDTKNTKLCRIDSEEKEAFKDKYNEEGKTLLQYSEYYVDNIFSKSYKECGLDGDTENKFKYKNIKYTIVPNYGEFDTFNPCIMREFNNIDATRDNLPQTHALLKEALQTLSFILLVNDEDKYQSIFKFQGDEKTVLEIKQTIYDFYVDKFFFGEKNYLKPDDIIIHAISDYKYKYVIFRFSLKDIHYHNYYVTLYNHYRMIEIDDLLRTPISYFGLVPRKFASGYECYFQPDISTLDFSYRKNQIIRGTGNDTLKTLCGINDFRVINNFYLANRYHSYCSVFYLIQTNGKYYEVSIKSVTFSMMKRRVGLINREYESKLSEFIRDYTNDPDSFVKERLLIPAELPAILEVIVNEVVPEKLLRVFMDETLEDYQKTVDIYRSPKFLPSVSLIIELIFLSELRRLAGDKVNEVMHQLFFEKTVETKYIDLKNIMEEIKKNPVLTFFFMPRLVMTRNFLVFDKLFDNNLIHLSSYVYYANLHVQNKKQELPTHDIESLINEVLEKINVLEGRLLDEYVDYEILKTGKINRRIVTNLDTAFGEIYNYVRESVRMKLLWYTPNEFKITDVKKFIELIQYVNDLHPKIEYGEEFETLKKKINKYKGDLGGLYARDPECLKLVKRATNFKEIYSKGGFLYTIRDLTPNVKEEIQEIIDLVDRIQIGNSEESYKYLAIVFHYPPVSPFGILHAHFLDKEYTTVYLETKRNYFNVLETKMYSWNTDIKNKIYYMKKYTMPTHLLLRLTDNYADVEYRFRLYSRFHLIEKIKPELEKLFVHYSNIYKNI